MSIKFKKNIGILILCIAIFICFISVVFPSNTRTFISELVGEPSQKNIYQPVSTNEKDRTRKIKEKEELQRQLQAAMQGGLSSERADEQKNLFIKFQVLFIIFIRPPPFIFFIMSCICSNSLSRRLTS